jgi:hypothetical protein
MSTASVNPGQLTPWSSSGDYNSLLFAIQGALAKLNTATLCQVQSCTNDGGLAPFGFVDVLPLVNQLDGNGNPTPHVTLYNIPYLRLQGGSSALILDPVAGDLGILMCCSRDISKIKSTQQQANPGSNRKFSLSDGLYLGGLLNAAPSQYVQFASSGITIVSPQTITLQAANIVLNGAVAQSNGNVTIDGALAQSGGDVTMAQKLTVTEDVIGAGISLQNHTHISAASGSPTGPPIP